MASRDSEPRRSMGPPQGGKKDPNPNTNYKAHFNRTKEKYDVVTADQSNRKKELDRATLKQAKLQEELEYLLDAIAGEQQRARQRAQAIAMRDESAKRGSHEYRQSDEEVPVRERRADSYRDDTGDSAKRQRPSPTDTEDELLETAGVPVKRIREQ